MARFALAAGALAIVVAGTFVLLRPSGQSNVGGTRSPGAIQPTPTPSASAIAADVPAVLRQDWQADVGGGTPAGVGAIDSRIQLSFGYDTHDAWLQTGVWSSNVRQVLKSAAMDDGSGNVRLVSSDAQGGCQFGDDGRYRWSISSNGLFLTLSAVSDACASRRTAFERTWVHSLAARNLGGPGVLSYFQPSIQMTFPAANWGARGESGAADVESDVNTTFVGIKNPAGFAAPCSATGGRHIAVQPTISAYAAYVKSMPGFKVTSTGSTIDGKPAVHLAITTTTQPACTDKLFEFAPNDLTSDGYWFITPGDPDSVWLVQVGKDLFLLQWLGNGVTPADEQSVLSTVQFIDALPAP